MTGVLGEPAPLQDLTTRQTKAAAIVTGVPAAYPAAFGSLITTGGTAVAPAKLAPEQVYLNGEAAQQLAARQGDTIRFFIGNRPVTVRVAGILRDQGLASGGLGGSGGGRVEREPEGLRQLPTALQGQAVRDRYIGIRVGMAAVLESLQGGGKVLIRLLIARPPVRRSWPG